MSSSRIVAIETSSRRGSLVLAEGEARVAGAEFASDLRHGVELLPCLARLCGSAGWPRDSLTEAYLSIGPGSFTGLRVAVAAVRHLALALRLRVVAVPSLAVIADNARSVDPPPERVAVVLDAKRSQVYAGLFERRGDGYEAAGPPLVTDPAAWLGALGRPLAVLGEGVAYHRAAVGGVGVDVLPDELALPRAESVHRLGWRLACAGRFTPPRELVPLYLRRPEAEEIWEQRHGPQRTSL